MRIARNYAETVLFRKNKNLNEFQNDPSEIQCVVNFAYKKDIDRQFEFKGH